MGRFIDLVDRVEARFLNAVNDAAIGGAANSVTGASPVPGQLGKRIYLTEAEANAMSLTTTGTLHEGIYQYVQFKAGSTAANAVGQLVVWDDTTKMNFVVTPDVADATDISKVAGVALNVVTKGNYGWIQIGGKATMKFIDSVTDKTDGNIVVISQAANLCKADAIADATSMTMKIAKSVIGIAAEAPADAGLKLVDLNMCLV